MARPGRSATGLVLVAMTLANGMILVDQMVAAKNDPLCCPSIKKKGKYRWSGSKILEVKTAR